MYNNLLPQTSSKKLDSEDYPFDDFHPEFHNFPGHWHDDELYAVISRFGFFRSFAQPGRGFC